MKKYFIPAYGIIAFILSLLPIIYYRIKFGEELLIDHEKWAQFGDFFGGVVNPFLALFSFLALLVTLRYQSNEIRENTDSRKANEIISALRLVEESITPKIEHILSRHYTLPSKGEFSYRMAETLSLDLVLTMNQLKELHKVSKSSSIFAYYKHKYLDIIQILFEKDYIDKEIKEFFRAAEE